MRMVRVARVLVLMLLGLCAAPQALRAQAVDEALSRLAADRFDDTQRAIEDLVQTGHPTAEAMLVALSAGRLFVRPADRAVFYRDEAGVLREARSGATAQADASALKPVRLNNRLRRSVEAALGALTLLAPDPGRRVQAAQAVFKARDPAILPVLEQALARETGGLSGRPLFGPATRMLAQTRLRVGDSLPLVGVGGVDSAEAAWTKILAGASLVQLYSALVYEGPGLVGRIKAGLVRRMNEEGITALRQVVGRDAADLARGA
jgi:hypothetical protein